MKPILLLAILAITLTNAYLEDKLWPLPTSYSYSRDGTNVTADPCNLRYVVESPGRTYVEDIIKLYQVEVFKCKVIKEGDIIVNVVVRSTNQFVATAVEQEKYTINIVNPSRWEIVSDYYPGFLRAY